jgi:hypothetical protein
LAISSASSPGWLAALVVRLRVKLAKLVNPALVRVLPVSTIFSASSVAWPAAWVAPVRPVPPDRR